MESTSLGAERVIRQPEVGQKQSVQEPEPQVRYLAGQSTAVGHRSPVPRAQHQVPTCPLLPAQAEAVPALVSAGKGSGLGWGREQGWLGRLQRGPWAAGAASVTKISPGISEQPKDTL